MIEGFLVDDLGAGHSLEKASCSRRWDYPVSPASKMETYFVYSQILKKEREKQRQTARAAAPQSPPVGKPIQTALPPDPQTLLLLASGCQIEDH